MSAPASHLLAGALLDAGAKATVVLIAAFAAEHALRRRGAASQHAMWAVVTGSLPLLVPSSWWARGQDLAVEATWLGVVWAIGAAIALAPLIAGRLWLGRIAARGRADGAVVRARPGDVAGPLTFGWWRPRIVVPADWDDWDPAHRAAALAHEAAHIARRDWAVHAGSYLACALLWFHPLVWAARRRLELAAEHAADELAIASGLRASDYAAALLHLTRLRTAPAGLSAGNAAAIRIRAVLNARARPASRGPTAAAVLAALSLTLPALASVTTWSPQQPPTCTPDGALP